MNQDYYSFISILPEASAWNRFPTEEDPLSRYKFTSVEINFSPDMITINRDTYSLLDWLGDLGGLLDALYIIASIFIFPIARFSLHARLLSTLFRYRATDRELLKKRHSVRRRSFFETHFDPADYEDEALI